MRSFTHRDGHEFSPPARRWLTTADAARMLEITRHGVRWLARSHRLAHDATASGQHLFREADVLRLVELRARARLVGRVPLGPVAIGEPRQLSLFGKARLRLVEDHPGDRAAM